MKTSRPTKTIAIHYLLSLCLKQATEGGATMWSESKFQIIMKRLAKKWPSLLFIIIIV